MLPFEVIKKIERVLPFVLKPARYTGGEAGSVYKNPADVDLRVALAFPDVYEVAFSHIGLKIIYNAVNGRSDSWAERVYCPWPDMEERMREASIPLYALESKTPIAEFDMLGFSLQHELNYTNILTMLDLAGLPLRAVDRTDGMPLVVAGGPGAANPEPVADFFDAIYLGESEAGLDSLLDALKKAKSEALPRKKMLEELARVPGVYVPSLWNVEYHDDGRIAAVAPQIADLPRPQKQVTENLDATDYPAIPLLPNVEPVHDRYAVEIQRGCSRGCRFCQAGMIYRPTRQRSPERILKLVESGLTEGGQDTLGLLSLSASDYACLEPLIGEIYDRYGDSNVNVQLPSLRVEGISDSMIAQMQRGRKAGFTLAPEAATERLRKVINKGNTEEEFLESIEKIYECGWKHVKLYFMVGLPTETHEDRKAIVELCRKARDIGRRLHKRASVAVAVSTFIPKAHTPFQWAPMIDGETVHDALYGMKAEIQRMRIEFRWHEIDGSLLEGVLARGDRKLADVIEGAWKNGARFDGWGERMDMTLWRKAFDDTGVDADFYRQKEYTKDDILPWDHLDYRLSRDFLWDDYQSALKTENLADCTYGVCYDCGVCDHKEIVREVYQSEKHPNSNASHVKNIPTDDFEKATIKHKSKPVTLRCRYSKSGHSAFLDHLHLVRIVGLAFRAAGVQVKYTEGHHPLAKFAFGQPLPVGVASKIEFFDVTVEDAIGYESLKAKVNKRLPEGLCIEDLVKLPEGMLSVFESVEANIYSLDLSGCMADEKIDEVISEFNAAEEIIITRQKKKKFKEISLKKYIGNLEKTGKGKITLTIRNDQNGSVRLSEVLLNIFKLDEEERLNVPILKTGVLFREKKPDAR